jgi:hypothetical protein
MGVLSALPLVAVGNACCLWVLSGGLVAAYVLQQNHPEPIAPAEGALAGWLAGISGAFVYVIVGIPVSLLTAPFERQLVQRLFETMGNIPPQFQELANRPAAAGLRVLFVFVGFLFMLGLGAIFSTIGGLLGAVIFQKTTSRVVEVPPVA